MAGRKNLTDKDRARVRTLWFDAHLSYSEIISITGFGKSQIRTAIKTPKVAKKSGRPSTLSPQQQDELVAYVTSSKAHRRMTFAQLAAILFYGLFGEYVIRHTLRRLGFKRYVAYRKPVLSEKNRALRMQFACDYLFWTAEDWAAILWSDETWVTGGRHRKTYVTRRKGEELDDTCVVERIQRRGGWMFWGCFSGTRKGPGVFWEKDWGSINQETYRRYIIPVVDGWLRMECRRGASLTFMQDNAPGHAAAATLDDLRERGIRVFKWPPFSPDLNPIETVWNKMKDYISDNYGDIDKPSYDQLRGWVKEAWEVAITEEFLQELIESMPARMASVVSARGGHTMY